jgi:hypothetical protein
MVIIKNYFNKNERFSMKNVKKIVILSLLAMLCSSEQASPMISWFANLEESMEKFTNKIYLIDEEEDFEEESLKKEENNTQIVTDPIKQKDIKPKIDNKKVSEESSKEEESLNVKKNNTQTCLDLTKPEENIQKPEEVKNERIEEATGWTTEINYSKLDIEVKKNIELRTKKLEAIKELEKNMLNAEENIKSILKQDMQDLIKSTKNISETIKGYKHFIDALKNDQIKQYQALYQMEPSEAIGKIDGYKNFCGYYATYFALMFLESNKEDITNWAHFEKIITLEEMKKATNLTDEQIINMIQNNKNLSPHQENILVGQGLTGGEDYEKKCTQRILDFTTKKDDKLALVITVSGKHWICVFAEKTNGITTISIADSINNDRRAERTIMGIYNKLCPA